MTDVKEFTPIYEKWSLENFQELFKIVMNQNIPVVLSNFIYGYTSLLANKEKFISIGYNFPLSFKSYQDEMPKFYASNLAKIKEIDNNFESVFQKSDKGFVIQELKKSIQENFNFIQLLKSMENTKLCVFKAGMLPIVGYLSKRFISYYGKNSFIELEHTEKSMESVFRKIHQSSSCSFSYDMGWENVEEWVSIIDCGKRQISPECVTMQQALYFTDFVKELLNQKSYQRNKKALAIIKCAAEDFTVIIDKVDANLLFMKNIESTTSFREIIDGCRSWISERK